MALTTANYQDAILRDFKLEGDPRARISLSFYWDLHADKGSAYLQYLYTRLSVIDAMLAGSWADNVDITEGDERVSHGQKARNLNTMRDAVTAEILRVNGGMSISSPVAAAPAFINNTGGEFG